MAEYNSYAYECSRNNAKVLLDEQGTEWINEFSEGIELEVGDQVRILGSFVNESSTGETVEISAEDNSANITFSPYIKGTTFSTSDTSDDLMKLGDYAEPAFSTDSFGIEPPSTMFMSGTAAASPYIKSLNDGTSTVVVNGFGTYFSRDTEEWYGDVNATGTDDVVLGGALAGGGQANQWRGQSQASNTWGTNLITSQNSLNEHNYNRWKTMHIPNDFYISTLCKKLILPVFHEIRTGNNLLYLNTLIFDPLVYDPPTAGPGMLSGCPKPGYMIATIDIGDSSGWYDEYGQSWNEIRDTNFTGIAPLPPPTCAELGQVNLKSGVQSVVGKVLAVRPIRHQTTDTYTTIVGGLPTEVHFDAFEVYVYDFFNPGLKNKIVTTTGAIGKFQKANTPNTRPGGVAPPDLNTTELNLRKQVHGAGEFADGYAYNPAFNHINGQPYQPQSGFEYDFATIPGANAGEFISDDGLPGCMAAMPTFSTMYKDGAIPGFTPTRGITLLSGNGESIYDEGSDEIPLNTSQYDYGYGKDMGLSFLWSGSDCGLMRFPPWVAPQGIPIATQQDQMRQYTSNTLSEMGLTGAGDLVHGLRVIPRQVNDGDTVINSMWNVGAMICCKSETMMDIINGEYDTLAGVGAGTYPRYWFPWTYQMGDSNYNERHYINNGYNSDAAGATYASNPDVGGSGIVRRNDEQRRNAGFVGVPWNINWRSQYLAGRVCQQTRGDQVATFGSGGIPASPDMMPRYWSTPDGMYPTVAPGVDAAGGPFVWGGYNNSNTSIHFQTPNSGDTDLCRTSRVIVIETTVIGFLGQVVFEFGDYPFASNEIADNDRVFVQILGMLDTWTDVGGAPVAGLGTGTRVTLDRAVLQGVPIGTKFMFTNKGNYAGCGTEGVGWSSDMICLKEYVMKVGVEPGFFTPSLLADKVNTQIHANTTDYATTKGEFNTVTNEYDVPTNVGLGEQAMASVPSIINSNMLHTTIPDISYGFLPVTTENATKLGQTASTKEITSEILNYDSYNATLGTFTFYYWWDLPPPQITDNLKIYPTTTSNTDIGFTTPCGTHTKFYTIPYLDKLHHTKSDDLELHLIRLKGGALRKDDYNTTATPPVWENQKSRYVGFETLRDASFSNTNSNYGPPVKDYFPDSMAAFWWKTRYVRNLFPNGGSCRIFSGANNPTITYSQDDNRISFSNLYTPFRPHNSENKTKTDFDVGDALPSAIIDSRKSGAITDSLCGVYINNLVGDALNQDNWGTFPLGNVLEDIEINSIVTTRGQKFWEKLGFSSAMVAANNNDFSVVSTPYTFVNRTKIFGNCIRNLALVDSAVNASNPMVSNCLQIAPVRQYMVQVDSDEIFGDANPLLGSSPYYLIGSDFPAKDFYGSTDGTKLPVIGICSRNFSSFNFVFDLGGSSITFTINEKRTIKSIRTKIFTQSMGTPDNLSKYSSVIYLVTKSNYINKLTPQQEQIALEQEQALRNAPILGEFYNPAEVMHRTEPPAYPPVMPQSYYQSEGSYYSSPEPAESDDSF